MGDLPFPGSRLADVLSHFLAMARGAISLDSEILLWYLPDSLFLHLVCFRTSWTFACAAKGCRLPRARRDAPGLLLSSRGKTPDRCRKKCRRPLSRDCLAA